MTEAGKVIQVKYGFVTVRVQRESACAKCGACAVKPNSPHIDITVVDTLDCEVGDVVELELPGTNVVKLSAWLYLMPLAAGIAAFIIAYLTSLTEILQLVFLFGGLALGFGGVFVADKFWGKKNKYQPRLVKKNAEILEKEVS